MSRRCKSILSSLLLTCLGILPACNQSPKPDAAKRYTLTGRVVSIDKPSQSITIDGNEIPGFMGAMQMPYPVKDATLLDKVAPGIQIKGEIVIGNEGAYLENIVVADIPSAQRPTK